MQADSNGYFEITLPGGEDHTYVLNISAPGYDSRVIGGSVKSGERKDLGKIRIDYNPFDLALAESSGSLERGWTPYVYDSYWSTTGKWSSWSYHSSGPGLWISSDPQPVYSSSLSSALQSAYDSVPPTTINYSYQLGSALGQILMDTDSGPLADALKNFGGSLARISYKYTAQAWKYVYNYYAGGWRETTLDEYKGYAFYDWVYVPDFWGTVGQWIYAEFRFSRYYSSGPIYISQWTEYEREWLGHITTHYTSRTNDYLQLPWDNAQTTVTATPRNGYTGTVKLDLEFDNGIDATLGKSELAFTSPASTTLTLTPKPDTIGSPHSATIRARDSNGRLVVGGPSKSAPTYSLSLTTLPKPEVTTTITSRVEIDTRIPPPVLEVHVGSPDGQVQGVSVGIYTRVLVGNRATPGSFLAGGTTDAGGVARFTGLPYNASLLVSASKNGYLTGWTSAVYNLQRGSSVWVQITKGSYDVRWHAKGKIWVRPNGRECGNEAGKVNVCITDSRGWVGGSISMSGILSEYFGSYELKPSSVGITQGEQVVDVYAHSNSKTPTISGTTCAVDVYGKAWVYTNRHAHVGYTVKLVDR